MFDGWAQTLKQLMKSDITVRSEVQNSQYIRTESRIFIFLFGFYSIFTLSHIFLLSLSFTLSLHFTPSRQSEFCVLHRPILKCSRANVQNANILQTNRSETVSAFAFFKMTWYCVAESWFQSLAMGLIFCINVYVWSKTNEQDQANKSHAIY